MFKSRPRTSQNQLLKSSRAGWACGKCISEGRGSTDFGNQERRLAHETSDRPLRGALWLWGSRQVLSQANRECQEVFKSINWKGEACRRGNAQWGSRGGLKILTGRGPGMPDCARLTGKVHHHANRAEMRSSLWCNQTSKTYMVLQGGIEANTLHSGNRT